MTKCLSNEFRLFCSLIKLGLVLRDNVAQIAALRWFVHTKSQTSTSTKKILLRFFGSGILRVNNIKLTWIKINAKFSICNKYIKVNCFKWIKFVISVTADHCVGARTPWHPGKRTSQYRLRFCLISWQHPNDCIRRVHFWNCLKKLQYVL